MEASTRLTGSTQNLRPSANDSKVSVTENVITIKPEPQEQFECAALAPGEYVNVYSIQDALGNTLVKTEPESQQNNCMDDFNIKTEPQESDFDFFYSKLNIKSDPK